MDSSRTECHNTATQLGFMGEKYIKEEKKEALSLHLLFHRFTKS